MPIRKWGTCEVDKGHSVRDDKAFSTGGKEWTNQSSPRAASLNALATYDIL